MYESIVKRKYTVERWQKIPWNDPDFSRRMLREHLSQTHDAASRRTAIIEQHVEWIDRQLADVNPARILDLGCGPGLYAARLEALGHSCTGIDFSPASIDYARQISACEYIQGDVRQVDFGTGYDLVMMIYGELNAFAPEDAQRIVDKAYAALKPGGLLILEVHPLEVVKQLGQKPPTWYSARAGLFSDDPHLCLEESFFKAGSAISRYFVIDAKSGRVTPYISMTRAYTSIEYHNLLRAFENVEFHPSLSGEPGDGSLFVITARKGG